MTAHSERVERERIRALPVHPAHSTADVGGLGFDLSRRCGCGKWADAYPRPCPCRCHVERCEREGCGHVRSLHYATGARFDGGMPQPETPPCNGRTEAGACLCYALVPMP